MNIVQWLIKPSPHSPDGAPLPRSLSRYATRCGRGELIRYANPYPDPLKRTKGSGHERSEMSTPLPQRALRATAGEGRRQANGVRAKIAALVALLILGGCSHIRPPEQDGPPKSPKNVTHIPNAQPKPESLSRYGNPASYEVFGKTYHVLKKVQHGDTQTGMASWYGTKFHGKRTSSGEPYDLYSMTAAHKHLPLPTYVCVKNLQNNREIVVKVNDRGPFVNDRIIDLSYAAAKKLGIFELGTAPVSVTIIDPTHPDYIKDQAKRKS